MKILPPILSVFLCALICNVTLIGNAETLTNNDNKATSASTPVVSTAPIKPKAANQSAQEQRSSIKNTTDNTYTLVGYDRNIKQSDFAGLSKAVVLQMQQQLEYIYKDLPDWKTDYSLKHQPLSDGIVGPITLSWLQRFGFNFKLETKPVHAGNTAKRIASIAQFTKDHGSELAILLSPEFEDWDARQDKKQRQSDYATREQGDDKSLLELVNRYRARHRTAPVLPRASVVDGGAYVHYLLNQEDIAVLGGKDQVMLMLNTLKDKEFNSIEALRVGVNYALGKREYLHAQIWPTIEKQAASYDGYLISEAVVAKLNQQKDPSLLFIELKNYINTYLHSQEAFDTFIAEKLAAFPIEEYKDEYAQLEQAARVFDNIHLSEQSLDNIKKALTGNVQNAGVSPIVADLLREIQDVDYGERSIFRGAVIARLVYGIAPCRANLPKNNYYVHAMRMDDEKFALLRSDITKLRPSATDQRDHANFDLAKAFTELGNLRGLAAPCDDASKQKGKDIVSEIYQIYFAELIENTAQKKMPSTVEAIKLVATDCACALDAKNNVIYAFYPYWDHHKAATPINFSIL
ncbi:MAG: hypothetical protein K2P84_01245, partial [Undibacterium sp.]|nr:hypothetical protein [Undibacterium sp.]